MPTCISSAFHQGRGGGKGIKKFPYIQSASNFNPFIEFHSSVFIFPPKKLFLMWCVGGSAKSQEENTPASILSNPLDGLLSARLAMGTSHADNSLCANVR